MKPVIFNPEAEAEFRASIAYYEGQRRSLGRDFRTEVRAALLRIRRNPQAFSIYDDQGT